MDIKKLSGFAAFFDKIVKVASKVFLALCIVCGVFVVLLPIFGERVIETGTITLDLDFVKIHLAQPYGEVTGMLKLYMVAKLLTALVICFCVQYGLKVVSRILKPIKEARTLERSTPMDIGKLAWLIFIGGIFVQLLGIASRIVLMLALPMEEILVSAAVTELEFVFSIRFGFVFVFLLLRLLAYALAYDQSQRELPQENE